MARRYRGPRPERRCAGGTVGPRDGGGARPQKGTGPPGPESPGHDPGSDCHGQGSGARSGSEFEPGGSQSQLLGESKCTYDQSGQERRGGQTKSGRDPQPVSLRGRRLEGGPGQNHLCPSSATGKGKCSGQGRSRRPRCPGRSATPGRPGGLRQVDGPLRGRGDFREPSIPASSFSRPPAIREMCSTLWSEPT